MFEQGGRQRGTGLGSTTDATRNDPVVQLRRDTRACLATLHHAVRAQGLSHHKPPSHGWELAPLTRIERDSVTHADHGPAEAGTQTCFVVTGIKRRGGLNNRAAREHWDSSRAYPHVQAHPCSLKLSKLVTIELTNVNPNVEEKILEQVYKGPTRKADPY